MARCQSCGAALGEGHYGTELDGVRSLQYCKECRQDGRFTEQLSLKEMVARVTQRSLALGYTKEQAERLAKETVPSLKRWR